MSEVQPLWISEAEVVELIDLPQAIDALEAGLRLQAAGGARNMGKTHVTWGEGDTLHAIGAAYDGEGVVGTKSWAHTEGGATPLLLLWDAATGALLAVVEAFALGQMRTGGVTGVATRWMADPRAEVLAQFGTGKQALAQIAAVAAVMRLKTVRIWGRDAARRDRLAAAAQDLGYGFGVEASADVATCADGAGVITLVTRARRPFFTADMAAAGAHINAVGAITPEREEFESALLTRASVVAADDPAAARRLSRELQLGFAQDEERWAAVRPLSDLVDQERATGANLSIFKAMGIGVSDLALGVEIHRRARGAGLGRPIETPRRAAPRLQGRGAALETRS